MRVRVGVSVLLALALGSLYVLTTFQNRPLQFTERELERIYVLSPLGTPPPDLTNLVADSPIAAQLGQGLFFDERLSGNGRVSCATCHNPKLSWTDGRAVATGLQIGARNTPSLWNASFNRWFFWDGRADTQWSQALQPLERSSEHGGNRLKYAHLIFGDSELKHLYEKIFGSLPDISDLSRFPPNARPIPSDPSHLHHIKWVSMSETDRDTINRIFSNMGKSIAAFERRIVSQNSLFDVFVEGLKEHDQRKLGVLPLAAQRGLKIFIGKGNCTLCHSGSNFSDGEFHNIRLPQKRDQEPDSGHYSGLEALLLDPFNSSSLYSDNSKEITPKNLVVHSHYWGQFKTPTLRNVAETAPYMHDGRFLTLEEVLRFYSTMQDASPLGHHEESILAPLNLSEAEIADLVAFLKSLSGK